MEFTCQESESVSSLIRESNLETIFEYFLVLSKREFITMLK
jgi:hypothetical protein